MKQTIYDIGRNTKAKPILIVMLAVLAVLIGYYIVAVGVIFPVSLGLSALLAVCLIFLVKYPVSGLIGTVAYCFILPIIGRELTIEILWGIGLRSEEHTSDLQSLMRTSYAVSCLK